MIVNGKNFDLNELMKTFDSSSNELQNVGNFYLTQKEIDILNRNLIDYKSCTSLKELMMNIEFAIDEEFYDGEEVDELDYLLGELSERYYYESVRK